MNFSPETLKMIESLVDKVNRDCYEKDRASLDQLRKDLCLKEAACLLAKYQLGHHSSRKECPCEPCKWAKEILGKKFTALDRIEVQKDTRR